MRILHKKLCLLMLLLISCHLNILAQGKIITGVILDKTGETVIGASVLVKGTTNGTITDVDGNFTLNNVQENAVLQVSFVGYKTQDMKVCQNAHLLSFTHKAPTFTSWGFVIT